MHGSRQPDRCVSGGRAMRSRLLPWLMVTAPVLHAAKTTAVAPTILAAGGVTASGAALSMPMQIVIMLTLLTLLPAALMSITPFLRITEVLHFLRQALGTQTAPSNQ